MRYNRRWVIVTIYRAPVTNVMWQVTRHRWGVTNIALQVTRFGNFITNIRWIVTQLWWLVTFGKLGMTNKWIVLNNFTISNIRISFFIIWIIIKWPYKPNLYLISLSLIPSSSAAGYFNCCSLWADKKNKQLLIWQLPGFQDT